MLFFYKKFPAHTRAGNLQTKQTNTVIHIMGLSLVYQLFFNLFLNAPHRKAVCTIEVVCGVHAATRIVA